MAVAAKEPMPSEVPPKVVNLVGGLHGALYCLDDSGQVFELVADTRDPFGRSRSWRRIKGPAENPYQD